MNGVNSVNLTAAATAFDRVAHSYDDVFTRSVIGRAQRNQVWQRLLAAFEPGERILELNCGTGEDARFLAQRGRSVVACDASSVMIEVAEGRGKLEAGAAGIEYRQLANEDLSVLLGQERFDGAFSNFSGLNCVADLQPVARNLAALVKPGGRVLICLWSRVCVGELAWFLSHGQVGKAFRRLSGKAAARVGGATIEVSYPTVRTVRLVFSRGFGWHRAARWVYLCRPLTSNRGHGSTKSSLHVWRDWTRYFRACRFSALLAITCCWSSCDATRPANPDRTAAGEGNMIILFNPRATRPRNRRLPLSVMALAAVLEGREEYRIVDGNLDEIPTATILDLIRQYKVELLGVSVMPGPQMVAAMASCKKFAVSTRNCRLCGADIFHRFTAMPR